MADRLAQGKLSHRIGEFIANTVDGQSSNFIKLSVVADGKRYTVSIPATGHRRTFDTRDRNGPR